MRTEPCGHRGEYGEGRGRYFLSGGLRLESFCLVNAEIKVEVKLMRYFFRILAKNNYKNK